MSNSNNSPYRLSWLQPAKLQLHRILAKAKELDIHEAVEQTLIAFEFALREKPDQLGDPSFHARHEGGVVCNAVFPPFAVRYVLFQQERIVLIWSIIALSRSVLSEE